jgi:hypothetical protein
MYYWFFLLEITVVKIMINLNICSAHSYLYPRSRFNRKDKSQGLDLNVWRKSHNRLQVFLPMKRSVLLKIIFFISLNYLDHINVGHVTYSFRIMLFISTVIFDDNQYISTPYQKIS